ncbi:MAG: glycosyltransferase family 9 protein [Bdellovibrionales bacterium]|nr:glycosyltransferase family 9 protein [Bdellovibrionales bacterium]
MRVVISRTDAIGDTVLTIPMARMLKRAWPDVHITFIVAPISAPLMLYHQEIDDLWVLDRSETQSAQLSFLYKKFKELKPDIYLYVGGSHLPSTVAYLQRVKRRGGLKSRWQSFMLLNCGVRQRRSISLMHELEYNLNLLAPLGIEYLATDRQQINPTINISEDEKNDAKNYLSEQLEKKGITRQKEMIVIHPGMTGHTLNWPALYYARLPLLIESRFPNRFLFVFSYTDSDQELIEQIKNHFQISENRQIEQKVLFFNGKDCGLRTYMSLLAQSTLFIGPSTGPTHLANILGVKMVGIYSPIKLQSAKRWGPAIIGSRTRVMVPDVVCGEVRRCAGSSCPYYECMSKIEVEDVLEASWLLLGELIRQEVREEA